MELITLTTKTRGRNPREVQYQGFGRIVKTEREGKDGAKEVEETVETDGVVTELETLLNAPGVDGDLQRILDFAVIGLNKSYRDAAVDVDEFADYLSADWDEEKVSAFKRSVRALAKVAEIELSDAAEMVLAKMNKAK